ncbi:hypothetical protein APF79_01790 [bacterium BRH_c32]|nr:MAG: hypothetical protein APF79_01790 [bacterium BRH_c32]
MFSFIFGNKKSKLVAVHFNKEKQKELNKVLGFNIKNKELYLKSFTHRSYLELFPELEKSNERLEFLGDSVLNMSVAKYLFEANKYKDEGFLTKARAYLVNRDNLFNSSQRIGLSNFLLLNKKYLVNSKEGMKTVLADATEALIAAIYLDKGEEITDKFIYQYVIAPYVNTDFVKADNNYKGQLLELAHANKIGHPHYKVIEEKGPEHKKEFTVEVYIGDKFYATGTGGNKKNAEQEASKVALEILHNQ